MLNKFVDLFLIFSFSYEIIIVALIAYLIGSIPTGYLIVKAKTGRDIRKIGSGSTGATNVKRVLGTKWFFIVLVLDALKGFLPVFFVDQYVTLYSKINLLSVVSAIAVVIGHSKPIFLGFKGGKSVATGVGTILALNFYVGLIIAAVWGTITYVSRYVSLGSVIAISLAPFLFYFFHEPKSCVAYGVICALYVIIRHKDNIGRLLLNQENKVR